MRKLLICAAVVAASWAAPVAWRTSLAQTVAPNASTTARVIVKFRADSTLLRKQALSATGQAMVQAATLGGRIGIALDAGRSISERAQVVIGHGLSSQQLAARIAAQSDVEYAVPDERKHIVEVPNDPLLRGGPDGRPDEWRPGGRAVVSAASGRRPGPPPTPRRRRSMPSRPGTSPRGVRASSSRCSTPACASTIPTCRNGWQHAARLRHDQRGLARGRSRPRATATAATPTLPIRATSSAPAMPPRSAVRSRTARGTARRRSG